jgi:hypothetical protein
VAAGLDEPTDSRIAESVVIDAVVAVLDKERRTDIDLEKSEVKEFPEV